MVYQAPIVSAFIVLVQGWRKLSKWLEEDGKNGKPWVTRMPLFTNHAIIMYVFLTYMAIKGTAEMYTAVLEPTNWMDETATMNFARHFMNTSDTDRPSLKWNTTTQKFDAGCVRHSVEELEHFKGNHEEHNGFQVYCNEANLDFNDMGSLKIMAFITPIWTFLTLAVCVFHTYQHLAIVSRNNLRQRDYVQRDRTLVILVLPVVYGLMSLMSVVRCMEIAVNHVPVPPTGPSKESMFPGFVSRQKFLLEMYETNFYVGDLYESIALWIFGFLISECLKSKLDKHMEAKKEATKKERVILKNAGHNVKEDDKVDEDFEILEKSIGSLTTAGVQLFCLACVLCWAYYIGVSAVGFYFQDFHPELFSFDASEGEKNLGFFQKEAMKTYVDDFTYGFSFAAAFAAIGNIVTVETDFHGLLHNINPSMKFWGTKVLVTLACVQKGMIGVICSSKYWSVPTKNLLYASGLSAEVLFIAIFHFYGWPAQDKWYEDSEPSEGGAKEPLLESEDVHILA